MDNNLFRKVDKSREEKVSRYEKYGLTRNPFPRNPGVNISDEDNRQNGSIYLRELRTQEEAQFEKILVPNDDRTETKTISFLMDYATRKGRGIGKTAFLNHQRGRINEDFGFKLSQGNEVLFAVYVAPTPNDNYRKFSSISKLILYSIVEQDILSKAICRLRVFSELIDERILKKVDNNLLETIGNNDWLINAYNDVKVLDPKINDFSIFELDQNVKRQLTKLGIEQELINILARFGCQSDDIFKYYLNKFPDFYWKNKANDVLFVDFVKIFELAGFTHGIILFEEVEKIIVPQTSLARREFCEALRYFFIDGDSSYNNNISFFKILLTIHPYLQELLNPHWNASGLSRFAGLSEDISDDYTVYFKPIDTPSAVPLAEAYINESRIKGSEFKGTYPFNEETLSLALKKSLGVPGKYLAFLHSVIERAIIEDWDSIGLKEIGSVSQKDTQLYENDENDDENDDDIMIDSSTKLK